jgi:hypothetical protein
MKPKWCRFRPSIDCFGVANVARVAEPKGSIKVEDYDKPWMRKKSKA